MAIGGAVITPEGGDMTLIDKFNKTWGIRHLRALIITYQINRHYASWAVEGFAGGWTEYEIEAVRKIRAGEL